MRNLEASTTYEIPFATSVSPDATPTATAYAEDTSLGEMAVTAGSGTNDYTVAVVLPANVTAGQVITVKLDWEVDGAPQSTVTLLVGQVGAYTAILAAISDAQTAIIARIPPPMHP